MPPSSILRSSPTLSWTSPESTTLRLVDRYFSGGSIPILPGQDAPHFCWPSRNTSILTRRIGATDGTQANGERERRMHHKFALFDSRTLATGSFNWTWYALLADATLAHL